MKYSSGSRLSSWVSSVDTSTPFAGVASAIVPRIGKGTAMGGALCGGMLSERTGITRGIVLGPLQRSRCGEEVTLRPFDAKTSRRCTLALPLYSESTRFKTLLFCCTRIYTFRFVSVRNGYIHADIATTWISNKRSSSFAQQNHRSNRSDHTPLHSILPLHELPITEELVRQLAPQYPTKGVDGHPVLNCCRWVP
jgi:hypothetical protein